MTEAEFMAAIIAAPEDDGPRLIYADWLDDRGGTERAEFIRVGVQANRLLTVLPEPPAPEHAEIYRLNKTLSHLIRNHWEDWWPWAKPNRNHTFSASAYGLRTIHGDGTHCELGIERGFVHKVRTTLAVWCGGERCERCQGFGDSGRGTARCNPDLPGCSGTGRTPGIAAGVCKTMPVERVVAVDREPWHCSLTDRYVWYDGGRESPSGLHPQSDLPVGVYAQLQGQSGRRQTYCPTRADADSALSDALIALGRRRAAGQPDTAPGGG